MWEKREIKFTNDTSDVERHTPSLHAPADTNCKENKKQQIFKSCSEAIDPFQHPWAFEFKSSPFCCHARISVWTLLLLLISSHPKEKQIHRHFRIPIRGSCAQNIQRPRRERLRGSPVCSQTFICVCHCAAAESSFGPN